MKTLRLFPNLSEQWRYRKDDLSNTKLSNTKLSNTKILKFFPQWPHHGELPEQNTREN